MTLSPGFEADAITVNPYVGGDGVLPFVTAATSMAKACLSWRRPPTPLGRCAESVSSMASLSMNAGEPDSAVGTGDRG